MVHSGFEASAVDEAFSSVRGMVEMIRGALLGLRTASAKDELTGHDPASAKS